MSDDLNDILIRIFQRNPDDRISIGELKLRIMKCSHFSFAHTQVVLTPPVSPRSPIVEPHDYCCPASTRSSSDAGSEFSDGSSGSSCLSISDDCDIDSGYNSPSEEEFSSAAQRPQAQAQAQQYALPHDSNPNSWSTVAKSNMVPVHYGSFYNTHAYDPYQKTSEYHQLQYGSSAVFQSRFRYQSELCI